MMNLQEKSDKLEEQINIKDSVIVDLVTERNKLQTNLDNSRYWQQHWKNESSTAKATIKELQAQLDRIQKARHSVYFDHRCEACAFTPDENGRWVDYEALLKKETE